MSKENRDSNIYVLSAAVNALCCGQVKYFRKIALAFHHCLEVPSRPVYQESPEELLQPCGLYAGIDLNRVLVAPQQTFL